MSDEKLEKVKEYIAEMQQYYERKKTETDSEFMFLAASYIGAQQAMNELLIFIEKMERFNDKPK